MGFFDWILARLASVAAAIFGALDALIPAVPSSVSGLCGQIRGAVTPVMAVVSPWLPWSYVGTAAAIFLLGITAGLAIRLVRIVASFATFGGGA